MIFFTLKFYSGESYYVSICPDFINNEEYGFPFGISVLFRQFKTDDDCNIFFESLNLSFKNAFLALKNQNIKPENVDFVSVFSYQYDSDNFYLCLNDNIFDLKEKVFLTTAMSSTELENKSNILNYFLRSVYTEFIENFE